MLAGRLLWLPPQMGMDVLNALLPPNHPQAVGSPLIACPTDVLIPRTRLGLQLLPQSASSSISWLYVIS